MGFTPRPDLDYALHAGPLRWRLVSHYMFTDQQVLSRRTSPPGGRSGQRHMKRNLWIDDGHRLPGRGGGGGRSSIDQILATRVCAKVPLPVLHESAWLRIIPTPRELQRNMT